MNTSKRRGNCNGPLNYIVATLHVALMCLLLFAGSLAAQDPQSIVLNDSMSVYPIARLW